MNVTRMLDLKSYRTGIDRAAEEVQVVCDRLGKTIMGEALANWLRQLPDDPNQPHPESPIKR